MKSSVRRALTIAGGTQKNFDTWMRSGQFTPQQVREAEALRATLLAKHKPKQTLGQRLAAEYPHRTVTVHITKREQEKEDVPMPTLEDKVERGRRMQKHITAAIDEIVKRDGCSRARAAEIVSYSPEMREMLDLERREDEILKSGQVSDAASLPARMQNSPTVGGGVQRPVSMLTSFNDAPAVRAQTTFNTPGDDNEVVSAADLLQQRAKALKDRNPGLSMTAAMDQAMKEPRVRKALDDEKTTRLRAASRLHG
jgi:hypothetical protein